jgi:isoleucyl-tRNA synthetase
MRQEVKANPKTLGPKLGPRLGEVTKAVATANPAELAAKVQGGQPFELLCSNGPVTLEPADVWVQVKAPEGWTGLADSATQIMIDSRVTPELAREGMAREVVRHVQSTRKDAGLEMEDRIETYLATDAPEVSQAIDTHRAYIGEETLTAKWASQPFDGGAHQAQVKVDGKPLTIELRKVAAK